MRHRTASPPLCRRLSGLVRQQAGRLLLGAAVILTVTALMLTIPVVSGTSERTSTVALESSSSGPAPAGDRGRESSPVQLGVDGAPAPSGAPGPSAAGAAGTSAPTAGAATGSGSGSTASDSPAGSSTAASTGSTAAGTSSSRSSSSSSSASVSSSTVTGSDAPSSPSATSDAPAPPTAPDAVDQVLALVNAQRTAAGCAVLAVDDTLATTAQAHSAAMRDRGYVGLVDPVDGSVLDQGARAGAVARGSADPGAVVAGWLADPADRAALLDCSLTSVGIGTADGDTGPWWTALLA